MAYQRANKEARSAYWKAYYRKHRRKRIAQSNAARHIRLLGLKAAVFKKYGKKCNHCPITDERVLCIDHVHGGGRRDRLKTGNIEFYRKVLADANGTYQILCHNCNWIKRFEEKEYVGRPRMKAAA